MKALIKKILKESEWFEDSFTDESDLPFEIAQNPRNQPQKNNLFVMKTVWEDGDRYLREEFIFKADNLESFELFSNVCKFYSKLMDSNGYDRWQDVDKIVTIELDKLKSRLKYVYISICIRPVILKYRKSYSPVAN